MEAAAASEQQAIFAITHLDHIHEKEASPPSGTAADNHNNAQGTSRRQRKLPPHSEKQRANPNKEAQQSTRIHHGQKNGVRETQETQNNLKSAWSYVPFAWYVRRLFMSRQAWHDDRQSQTLQPAIGVCLGDAQDAATAAVPNLKQHSTISLRTYYQRQQRRLFWWGARAERRLNNKKG